MGRRLARTVVLRDPANLGVTVLLAGTVAPGWAVPLISNPAVWGDDEEQDAVTAVQAPQQPPRSGAGSGRDAWVAYAAAVSVEHDQDATRDEIIAAVEGE